MKAKVQRLIGTAVLGLALLLNSLPAWAGVATSNEVYIHGSSAQGSLTGTRYSADSEQYIGCGFENRGGYPPLVLCVARDNRGRSLSCASSDPRIMDALKAMTDSSHIYFRALVGGCELTIENSSLYLR